MKQLIPLTFTTLLLACGGDDRSGTPGQELREAFEEMSDGDGTWKDAGPEWADVRRSLRGDNRDGFIDALRNRIDDLEHDLDPARQDARHKVSDLRAELEDLGDEVGDAWEEAGRNLAQRTRALQRELTSS